MSKLHTDDKESQYSKNPHHLLKSAKNFYEKLYIKKKNAKTAIAEHFCKISNKEKISNKQFYYCQRKIVLKKVANSINSQTNIKSSGNDSVTTKFYKRLSNELTLFINNILSNILYVYQTWKNLGTIGVSSGTGLISAIYNKEDIANCRPISLIFRCNNVSISKYQLHNST